jgi:hypothetical protein
MFIHDTGKICVYVATRCGHTSAQRYFNVEPYRQESQIDCWINTSSKRVLVLRNPYSRVTSGFLMLQRFDDDSFADFEDNFIMHTKPYIADCMGTESNEIDFAYINFEKLIKYIPMDYTRTRQTHSYNSKQLYIYNRHYSKEHLEQEYALYLSVLRNKKEISVEEWKELTQ